MSNDGASYVPESPVLTSRVAFVCPFVIVMVAPFPTAPVLSVTVPTIVALFVWAVAGIARTPSKKMKVPALTNGVAIFRMMDIVEPRKKIGSTLSPNQEEATSTFYCKCIGQCAVHDGSQLSKNPLNTLFEPPPQGFVVLAN